MEPMDRKALEHFKKNDSNLYKIALLLKLEELKPPANYFVDLVDTIINQQLSAKAGATIFSRVKNLFSGGRITPEKILKIPDEKLRKCGMSYSKIKYIKGIAEEIKSGRINLKNLEKLTDKEVISELTKLKGVGTWTAEMFLIFSLLRPDVFSAKDLGLRNAVIKLYKLDVKTNDARLLEISAKWSPFRTTASRILWHFMDN